MERHRARLFRPYPAAEAAHLRACGVVLIGFDVNADRVPAHVVLRHAEGVGHGCPAGQVGVEACHEQARGSVVHVPQAHEQRAGSGFFQSALQAEDALRRDGTQPCLACREHHEGCAVKVERGHLAREEDPVVVGRECGAHHAVGARHDEAAAVEGGIFAQAVAAIGQGLSHVGFDEAEPVGGQVDEAAARRVAFEGLLRAVPPFEAGHVGFRPRPAQQAAHTVGLVGSGRKVSIAATGGRGQTETGQYAASASVGRRSGGAGAAVAVVVTQPSHN